MNKFWTIKKPNDIRKGLINLDPNWYMKNLLKDYEWFTNKLWSRFVFYKWELIAKAIKSWSQSSPLIPFKYKTMYFSDFFLNWTKKFKEDMFYSYMFFDLSRKDDNEFVDLVLKKLKPDFKESIINYRDERYFYLLWWDAFEDEWKITLKKI